MQKSWLKKIGALKRLINEVGPLWPKSTKLAGYGEDGPYHCEDCIYLKKDFKDETGKGRCKHPVVVSDSQVTHDSKGLGIVNIEHGCCEFVEQSKDNENGEETP